MVIRVGLKRGAAHFEMIISFVLFIGFVTFLFLFLSPYSTKSVPENLINDVYNSFTEQTLTNLTTLFLKTDFNRPRCFNVELPEEIFKYGLTKSVVYAATGEKRDSMISGNKISIDGRDKFFNIFVSPIFSENSLNGCIDADPFTIGSVKDQEILAYPKIIDIADEYGTDYSGLKSKLAVPPNYDFAITSKEIGLSMQRDIPKGVDVLSKSYVEKVLQDNATIINLEFVVKVW